MEKFYLTTPIYYVNDKPHIGHLYTTVAADVIARYQRLLGREVFFLTGTDENATKNVEAAEKAGMEIEPYLETMSTRWRDTWTSLGITFDRFIRTTEKAHLAGVEKFWNTVFQKGDIYEGTYEGWYCVGCEAFKTENELVDGKCPLHLKEPKRLKERNWFFKLTKYRTALLEHIDAHPTFIEPKSRRNEVRNYVEKFMEDVSISREGAQWGIPVPHDPKSIIYVWFDALINYLTGVGYGTDDAQFAKWWPADLHLVGKDIIKFHCALWPAMLMSADVPLPRAVFAHGFFTINGQKMSKSLGNVVDPLVIAKQYGRDAIRYFLLHEIAFGEDGDFSEDRLRERYVGELGNTLGNLFYRVLSMVEKYCEEKIPTQCASSSEAPEKKFYESYGTHMDSYNFLRAIDCIFEHARDINGRIDSEKPWALAKMDTDKLKMLLYAWLEELRIMAWYLKPFMPETAEKMLTQLGDPEVESKKTWDNGRVWGGLSAGTRIQKGEPLFPRIEMK